MISKEQLIEFVSSRSWYQTINFTEGITSKGCEWCGDPAWSNIVKFLPQDLKDKSVLDLGCNAGIFCVRSALMGAEALGIDYPGWRPNWDFIEQRVFVKKWFEQEYNNGDKFGIDYISGRMEEELPIFENNLWFDYVFGIASLYYTEDPDGVVESISKITDKAIIRLRDANRIERFTKLFKKFGFKEKDVLREKWWEKLGRQTDDFYLYLFEK